MKTRKIFIYILVAVILFACIFPFPKKIDNSFRTLDQNNNEITITIKGTCYFYLIRRDKFDGILIDENGKEYPAVQKQDLEKIPIGVEENLAIPVNFAYLDIDAMETEFVNVYFDEKMENVYQCAFIE